MPLLPWGGRQAQPSLVRFTFYLSLPFYLYSLQVKRQLPLQCSAWLCPRQQASGEQPEALTGNFSHLNGKCDTVCAATWGEGVVSVVCTVFPPLREREAFLDDPFWTRFCAKHLTCFLTQPTSQSAIYWTLTICQTLSPLIFTPKPCEVSVVMITTNKWALRG